MATFTCIRIAEWNPPEEGFTSGSLRDLREYDPKVIQFARFRADLRDITPTMDHAPHPTDIEVEISVQYTTDEDGTRVTNYKPLMCVPPRCKKPRPMLCEKDSGEIVDPEVLWQSIADGTYKPPVGPSEAVTSAEGPCNDDPTKHVCDTHRGDSTEKASRDHKFCDPKNHDGEHCRGCGVALNDVEVPQAATEEIPLSAEEMENLLTRARAARKEPKSVVSQRTAISPSMMVQLKDLLASEVDVDEPSLLTKDEAPVLTNEIQRRARRSVSIGSVSTGTADAAILAPKFINTLRGLWPEAADYAQGMLTRQMPTIAEMYDDLAEYLYETLNFLCPEGVRFGSASDDDHNIGFWILADTQNRFATKTERRYRTPDGPAKPMFITKDKHTALHAIELTHPRVLKCMWYSHAFVSIVVGYVDVEDTRPINRYAEQWLVKQLNNFKE